MTSPPRMTPVATGTAPVATGAVSHGRGWTA
ncbi:hypothetical protein APS67_004072 [Streptomyces sp. AVP053U2]|nr:hypothetical protein APS67_004072 [Streptomyces sp. AVP053U2]